MENLFQKLLEYYSITKEDFDLLNKDVNPQLFVNQYRFDNVKEAIERNLRILKNNPDQYWEEVNDALLLNRYFRFHVSGDIPNRKYLEKMVEAARKNSATQILCFTKKYELVNKFIADGNEIPENLHLLFSKWRGLEMPNPYQLPEDLLTSRDEP